MPRRSFSVAPRFFFPADGAERKLLWVGACSFYFLLPFIKHALFCDGKQKQIPGSETDTGGGRSDHPAFFFFAYRDTQRPVGGDCSGCGSGGVCQAEKTGLCGGQRTVY